MMHAQNVRKTKQILSYVYVSNKIDTVCMNFRRGKLKQLLYRRTASSAGRQRLVHWWMSTGSDRTTDIFASSCDLNATLPRFLVHPLRCSTSTNLSDNQKISPVQFSS